jgi:hypothetical protein
MKVDPVQYREPIAATYERNDPGRLTVVCNDGAVFVCRLTREEGWIEIAPVPGSLRAQEKKWGYAPE